MATNPGPCPQVSEVQALLPDFVCRALVRSPREDRLLIGGVGGGSPGAIGLILQTHAVTHLVVCGRVDQDVHVAAAREAVVDGGTELHIAPLVPDDKSDICRILDSAVAFIQDALDDELNAVLVACSKGASRSVAVVLAYLMSGGADLASAFDLVASARWRIWPSALLVDSLMTLEARAHASCAGACSKKEALPAPKSGLPILRRIGAHAAWATAWHNGIQASLAEAEDSWDQCKGLPLEEAFAKCKQALLGKSTAELELFADQPRIAWGQPPHAQVDNIAGISDDLKICGLGGLSASAIASMLQKHCVKRVVVCGEPDRDAHVSAVKDALSIAGISTADLHIVPVRDSASEDLGSLLASAIDFVMAVPGRATLIACRQGASRSATVAIACLVHELKVSVLEAFNQLAASRWRLWPNAGFVQQLLAFEDSLKLAQQGERTTDEYKEQVLRKIGIHAAWATNKHNLRTGSGQQGLTMQEVEKFWNQAAREAKEPEERFELCKSLSLGVDLTSFDAEPDSKRACVDTRAEEKRN
ncbi:Dusp5 [Symbiodinium sp. CCMP2592]|nr:Dusp5 [Symbiodinium sp. CCMP2592]